MIGPGGAACWLSAALGVAAAASSLLTFTVPAVLRGTAVMNGSARGTALVVLLAGVPALACSMLLAARGSAAAVITWLGAAGFLLYNSLMFVFATPANRLFPLYLAMLALAASSAGALLGQADVAAFGALFSARTPVRGISVYMWTVVALNAAAWLARIVPAVARGGAPGLPARHRADRQRGVRPGSRAVAAAAGGGRGLAVAASPLGLPARRRGPGHVGAGERQHRRGPVVRARGRPGVAVASGALVPAFAALAVIGLIPAGLLLHGLSGGVPGVTAAPRLPVAARRGRHPWVLAGLDGLTGAAALSAGPG